jgi:hypothetical protein
MGKPSWRRAALGRCLLLIIDFEHRIGNESISIRHFDLWQTVSVDFPSAGKIPFKLRMYAVTA